MVTVRSIAYLVLGSNRREEWRHFFTDFLGMEVSGRDDGTLAVRMDDHACRFLVQPGDAEDLWAAGFDVGNREELDALAEQLAAKGIEVHRGSAAELASRQVEGLIWFRDPEGLRLEVVCNPRIVAAVPFTSRLVPGGFVTGDQGFGHIAIAAANIQACEDFYKDLLGFRISDYVVQDIQGLSLRFTFFHVNPRHHTLALAGVPGVQRMHHFMVQMRGVDEVGRALERAKLSDIPIHMEIGRHANDRMLSFYAMTPSGSNVEVGTGGLEIRDEGAWSVRTYDTISEWGHKF